jgi:hypothetical protein
MTQSNGHGIVLDDSRLSGIQLGTLEESRGGANPYAAPPPVPQAEPDPAAAAAQAPMSPEEMLGYAEPAPDPEQAALEARHGQGETAVTQYARGALSALLSPGSLLGLQHETFGRMIGNKTWEDFGRRVGEAASGRSALESARALGEVFTGGSVEDATSAADRARLAIDEQEKAWPLLSTVSQIGGGVAFGVATGGLASGGASSLKGLAALGVSEGAGAGAQAAYDADAPLADVWTSALVGGAVGGALVGGASAGGKLIGKAAKPRADLQKVFGEGEVAGSFGEKRVAEALGFKKPFWKKHGAEEVQQIAKDVRDAHLADGRPVFPDNLMDAAKMDKADIAERLLQKHQETGAAIGEVRQRASSFIDQNAPQMRPSPKAIADRMEIEVAAPLMASVEEVERSAGRAVAQRAANMRELGDSISLEELVTHRKALAKGAKFDASTHSETQMALQRAERLVEDEVVARVDMAAEAMGEANHYLPLKRQYTSFTAALKGMEDGIAGAAGNNKIGITDSIIGAGAAIGDLAGGGGMMSLLKGAAVGYGSKLIREKSPQIAAVLARRFARTPASVDLAVAGGREAQDVLTEFVRVKNFLKETGERSGPNPNIAAIGENSGFHTAADEIAKRAGTFDPAAWSTVKLSPLARTIHRTQILDALSNDLAPTVQRSAALRPGLDFDIDAGKLARLTKDADGPEAIGAVQAKVREIADAMPPDSAAKPALEAALQRLETADVAGAMVEGHTVVRGLSELGGEADARSLALVLGDDTFGEAGRMYRQTIAPPDEVLKDLADPTKLRDALRQLELRGQLSQLVANEHRATAAAWSARSKLTGEAMPEGLKKQMREIESLWAKGEEHVTLDGARFGRVVDALENMVEQKVASRVPKVATELQVQETIKKALSHVEPALKPALRAGLRGRAGRATGRGIMTGAARLAQYEERLDQITQATVMPDTDTRTAAIGTAPPELRTTLVSTMDSKLAQLQRDMPKPKSDIRGPAINSLSSDDIRRGTAMWEATMEPLSVFEDFARGDVDPDKVAYAWKQYPGLQKAAQMGVLDIMQSQLSDEERSALPGSTLTQLDMLLGFNGALQGTVEFSFSQRMTALGEQAKQAQGATPPAPSRALNLPKHKSLTERLSSR